MPTRAAKPADHHLSRPVPLFFGGWELGLLCILVALYVAGSLLNPEFFLGGDAIGSVLRDASRIGIMACGMTFVIVNRDLDLSVGSIMGLVAVTFSVCYAADYHDIGVLPSLAIAVAVGLGAGLANGLLVTVLLVPAFIATLTMLFIGRGLVLALTVGRTITYNQQALGDHWFFALGERTALGINAQVLVFLVVAALAIVALARTRLGLETYAVGGNERAAAYAGINTRLVRIRGYIFSALTATCAGLLSVAQNKGVDSSIGVGNELIVIAATIVGGGAIAGGRGRVGGAVLGAVLVVLIDVVLRQGWPITKTMTVGDTVMMVRQMAQLPPGAVPAFLGTILVVSVALGPYLARKRPMARLWARLRHRPPPSELGIEGVAIEQPPTIGSLIETKSMRANGLLRLIYRRDAAAIILVFVLWLVGWGLRPDYWANLDNTFNLALAFTEIGFLAIGLTFVMANGDVDLSVGSVLALSASTAAYLMHELHQPPVMSTLAALAVGTLAGLINGMLTVRFRMPAFVATLGMFYIARGIGAWFTAGRQLSGFPAEFTVIGRKVSELLQMWHISVDGTPLASLTGAVSVQTILMAALALVTAVLLGRTVFGQMVYAVGGNQRAAAYAGISAGKVRFLSLLFSAFCAALAGVIYVAYLKSFNPAAGVGRELDGIAAVIIGGGSIFGGYGTIVGSLAGALVITLIRGILSLQIILPDGSSFVMPQHWLNVFVGGILLVAVIGDIWIRQRGMLSYWTAAARISPKASERLR